MRVLVALPYDHVAMQLLDLTRPRSQDGRSRLAILLDD
jgi:hypothetical protein